MNDISTLAINVVQNGWGYQECLDLLLHAPAGGEVHGPASGRAEERLPAATRRMLEGICEELVAANRRRVDAALRRGRPARESRGSAEESSHRQDSET